jgi:hypothetical protein
MLAEQIAFARTWEIFWQVHVDDLSERMDPCVGAPGTDQKWRTLQTTESLEG